MSNLQGFGVRAARYCAPWLLLLAGAARGTGSELIASAPGEAASSEQAVAVLLVSFPGQPAPPVSREQAREALLGTSGDWRGAEVFGWFRLDREYDPGETGALREAALRAAAQAADLRGYGRVVVLFPRLAEGCWWWAVAGEEGELRFAAMGDPAAGAASDNVVQVAGTQPPTAGWVLPASGTGPAEAFTFLYSDPDGYTDLKLLRVNVNTSTSLAAACAIEFDLPANTIRLADDAGTGWLGPVPASQAHTLQNSQCQVRGAGGFR